MRQERRRVAVERYRPDCLTASGQIVMGQTVKSDSFAWKWTSWKPIVLICSTLPEPQAREYR